MPHYIVGKDWPDHFYATNAKWPVANEWTWLPKDLQKPFHASTEEVKRAVELEKQAAARREAHRLKRKLFDAIIEREVETVRHLIRRAPLLLERHTKYGATPLGLAAAVGDPAIVALLLDEGSDVAATDLVGATPLIAAAARGHTEVCLQLLDSKQGGNRGRQYLLRQATTRAGEVAAHAAAKGGHLDTLVALVEAGADPLATDRGGRDCLMMAAANDHPRIMSYLLQPQYGTSPNRTDHEGLTALMHAAAGAALQAVQLLLSLEGPGMAPELERRDGRGYGPLHHACLGGSVDVIQELTSRGLSLSPLDPESLELLRLACRSGHEGVVGWMLQSRIGSREVVSDGSANPVFSAVRGGSWPVVEVLLKHGARIDARDSKGRTPLGVAAEAGDTALCRQLVAAGASLLAADNHGRVPRKLAYLANKRDTAEVLAGMARMRLVVSDDVASEQLWHEMDREAEVREAEWAERPQQQP